MFTRLFWRDTTERVIASAAGGVLTALGMDAVDILQADWKVLLGAGIGTGFVSLLKALVASKVKDPESASLVDLNGPVG